VSLTREPVEIDARRMTPARRAKIIARDNGKCVRPFCETPTEALQVDHIVALELGGRDADWNCETLCTPHHKIKTRADASAIAKAKRRKLKAEGQFPPSKTPLRSRNTFARRWVP
jgi:5-methylcytosine-specific restriction endonuclease McrA